MTNRRAIVAAQLGFLILLLSGCEYLVDAEILNKLFIAAPSSVAIELWNLLFDPYLYTNLGVTLYEFVVGFSVSVLLAVISGIAIARVSFIRDLFGPFLSVFMSMPKVAIIPIIIIWVGIGPFCKMLFVFLNSYFHIVYNTISAVQQIPENHLKVCRSLGANPVQITFKALIPAALPSISTGVRASLPAGLMGAIFAEMLGARAGLGMALVRATAYFNTPRLFALVTIITLLFILLSKALYRLENRVFLRWKQF